MLESERPIIPEKAGNQPHGTRWREGDAGVMESGNISYPKSGSPQGGVVSPILSNLYLHEVMDKWFTKDVLPRLRGRAFLVRYADDQLIACEREDDAHRIMEVLPKRFGRFDLELHPSKTRLVDFRRPKLKERKGYLFSG